VPHDKHRNLGPVLTLVPDLVRDEIIRRKALDLSGPQLSPLLSFLQGIVKPILVNERRVGEAREDGKKPRVLSLAPDGSLSDEIRSDPSDAFPVLEVVDVGLVLDLDPHWSVPLWFIRSAKRGKPRTSLLYTRTRRSPTNIPISSFASFCSGTRSFCVNFGSAMSIVMIFSRDASLFVIR
jgi:hypothetical protein